MILLKQARAFGLGLLLAYGASVWNTWRHSGEVYLCSVHGAPMWCDGDGCLPVPGTPPAALEAP